MPAVGSSKKRSLGPDIRLRAMSSRLFTPPEKADTGFFLYGARPNSAVRRSMRPAASAFGTPYSRAWKSMFSSSDMWLSMDGCCAAQAIWARISFPLLFKSFPSMVMSPESGRRYVVRMRISVDFPAPFGPSREKISPF